MSPSHTGHEPDVDPGARQNRVRGSQSEVTGERQVQARAHRWAVDRRDDGHARAGDRPHQAVEVAVDHVCNCKRPLFRHPRELGKVASRTKGRRSASDDDSPHVRIARLDRLGQGSHELDCERIPPFGTIQRQKERRSAAFVQESLCGVAYFHFSEAIQARRKDSILL